MDRKVKIKSFNVYNIIYLAQTPQQEETWQVCVILKAPSLDPIKSPKPECVYIDLKKAKMYLHVQTLPQLITDRKLKN